MAKEPTRTKRTPEEIAEMKEEVRQYEAEQAAEKAKADREAATALVELVEGGAIDTVLAALPALDQLSRDRSDVFPNLRVYVDAARNGLEGFRRAYGSVPPAATDAA